MPKTITLNTFVNDHPYHISIVRVNGPQTQAIIDDVIDNFEKFFGETNSFTLIFDKQWGRNSIFVESFNPSNNIDLQFMREYIFDYVRMKYPDCIDTSRYNADPRPGFPPQHIDVRGDMTLIGKKFTVTYSFH